LRTKGIWPKEHFVYIDPYQINLWKTARMATASKVQRELTSSSLSTCASSNMPEYPAALVVRNTFLDFKIQRPESLEGFLNERHVRSAPGSRLEEMCSETQMTAHCQEPQRVELPAMVKVPRPDSVVASAGRPSTLQLAELITEPQPGSPELPTVGSKHHSIGGCKPCAFIWKEQGCENGVNCPFCHLCDAGEKRRRAKEKKERIRSLQAGAGGLRQAVVRGINRMIS